VDELEPEQISIHVISGFRREVDKKALFWTISE
jgi:hypothetical protein